MTCSLIISTYNWPEALDLVLQSVLEQSVMPNEVIIADDGSSEETKNLIHSYQRIFTTSILHVWHKDEGFRRTAILNKAIFTAKSQYIIQIDGDVILHREFIRNHIANIRSNTFVHGSRAMLNKELTNHLISTQKIKIPCLSLLRVNNLFNCIYLPFLSPLFTLLKFNLNSVRGCNLAFSKADFISVNGYNEEIIGWGKEDTELVIRFINKGIKTRKLKMSGVQYHLHHTSESRQLLNKNTEILKNTMLKNTKKCQNGVNKYCNEE